MSRVILNAMADLCHLQDHKVTLPLQEDGNELAIQKCLTAFEPETTPLQLCVKAICNRKSQIYWLANGSIWFWISREN